MPRGAKSPNWTPDTICELVRLMEDTGLSCENIARKINRDFGTTLTKSAIIGYWRRLNGGVCVERKNRYKK